MARRSSRKKNRTAAPNRLLRSAGRIYTAKKLFESGEVLQAKRVLRDLLADDPTHGEGNHLLGWIELQQHDLARAESHLRRAVASQDPKRGGYYKALGLTLNLRGRFEQACEMLQTSLDLQGGDPEVHNALAVTLQGLGRFEEAVVHHEECVALTPRNASAWYNFAVTMLQLGQLGKGIRFIETCLLLNGDDPKALLIQGSLLSLQGKASAATAVYRRIRDLQPDHRGAVSNLLLTAHYEKPGSWYDIPDLRESLPTVFGARDGEDGKHRFPSDVADKSLRVGFVSGDLKNHSVAFFLEPLLAALGPDQFSAFCYSNNVAEDRTTQRLKSLSKGWRTIAGWSDERVLTAVRDDGIDILIDLSGHTQGNRLGVFARRAAPLQVTWLGYPGTSGLAAMDYQLTCSVADPDDRYEPGQTERLVRLPDGFHCYGPPQEAPDPGPPPILETGRATLACFNNPSKITTAAIRLWSEILTALPGSRIYLKGKAFRCPDTRDHFLKRFAASGIAADRVLLEAWLPDDGDHLSRYRRTDLALDPFPYNGVTTTCEALWMGVPVITLRGDHRVGRMGASLLTQAGLEAFIAENERDYVAKTVALATDNDRLSELRRGLRSRLQSSPLCDAPGFARKMDAALRTLWRDHCR